MQIYNLQVRNNFKDLSIITNHINKINLIKRKKTIKLNKVRNSEYFQIYSHYIMFTKNNINVFTHKVWLNITQL